jgi:hypothetical protein
MPKLGTDHRRALEILAGSPGQAAPRRSLPAHGIARDVLAELILDGLASADTVRVMAGRKVVDVRRIRIDRSSCLNESLIAQLRPPFHVRW